LGAQVYTIERQKKLYESIRQFEWLKKYPTIRFFYGDGYEGLPTFAPFDKIIVTAAAPAVPPKLVEQLKAGGKMVIPVGEGKVQRMLRISKSVQGEIQEEEFEQFSFVPMVGGRK
jgi:protein-L-isoaspartate(D-aspartate) O-methyltransferase